ncbi:MAG: tetratricopeptide repeat protein [Planctomycetota bacterium]|nr:tetratricopeptide repeat protein [Planctomycetota bacterium]
MLIRIPLVAFVSCLALGAESIACLNTYGTTLHGHSTVSSEGPLADELRRAKVDRETWVMREAELAQGLESADYMRRSDYAVALIYLGRYDEAIRILQEVEREHPGEYIVAANLGTAYELTGDLEEALLWIKRGVERNADSHQGSEWLHVEILQAKLQLAKDPHWLKTNTVLGVDFGNGPVPSQPRADLVDSMGRSHDLEDVAGALEYQLVERLKFVPPQDPIVADLLFDLGNVVALMKIVEQAIPIYEFAREYGMQNPTLLDRRISQLQELAASNPRSGQREGALTVGVIVGAGASFLCLIVVVPIVADVAYRRLARSRASVR